MSFEQAVVQLEQTNAKLQEEVIRFRDAAMGLNNVWPTVTEGRQNTSDGKYFSVPGSGAYMRLYRRSGSSASLIAEFPDVATLNGLIAQLGPLVGRGVVGGSGDLMADGAYGFGSGGIPAGDVSPGEFREQTASLAAYFSGARSPTPTGGAALVLPRGADYGGFLQLGNDNNLYFESQSVGVWGGLNRTYSDRNILGAVSQVDGLPTGGIVERGENANGQYVKIAGGLALISRTVEFDMSVSTNEIYGYPILLQGTPVGSGSPATFGTIDINNWGEGSGSVSCRTSGWNVRMGIPKTGVIPVQLFGLGFWH